jgi:hypothetical protein
MSNAQKYHMKILLGAFNAKVGREDIFKATIWNVSLHEISNDNGVKAVDFATSENLKVRAQSQGQSAISRSGRNLKVGAQSQGHSAISSQNLVDTFGQL